MRSWSQPLNPRQVRRNLRFRPVFLWAHPQFSAGVVGQGQSSRREIRRRAGDGAWKEPCSSLSLVQETKGRAAVSSGLTTLDVRTLAIDPQNPDAVYAGTVGGGVFVISFAPAAGPSTPTATPNPDNRIMVTIQLIPRNLIRSPRTNRAPDPTRRFSNPAGATVLLNFFDELRRRVPVSGK